MKPMTREQVREVDRRAMEEYGIPGLVLMENAGRGAADVAQAMLAGVDAPRVAVLCGKGNNGGDGFVLARHLHNRGYPVELFYTGRLDEPGEGDAAVNRRIARRMGLPIEEVLSPEDAKAVGERLRLYDLVVDALLGMGLRGAPREPARSLIEAVNAAGRRVLAVDIPSGLDCDTGEPLGLAVKAERTVTFAANKIGFTRPAAREYCGAVKVADIGAPRELVE